MAVKIHAPAACVIRVQGVLSRSWSTRFGGLRVAATEEGPSGRVTVLSGTVLDQSALMGILSSLVNLGLPVVSVEVAASSDGEATDSVDSTAGAIAGDPGSAGAHRRVLRSRAQGKAQ